MRPRYRDPLLMGWGALAGGLASPDAWLAALQDGRVLRLVTALFLHADWAHLLGALRWHLSLSDTRDTAFASVLVEGPDDYPRRPPGPPPWVRRRLDRQRGAGA